MACWTLEVICGGRWTELAMRRRRRAACKAASWSIKCRMDHPPLVLLALTPLLTADVVYEWRGEFDNAEVNRLHAEGFERRRLDIEWRTHPSSRATVWEGNGSLLTAP